MSATTVSPRLVVQPSAWWVGHLAHLLARYGVRDPEAEARAALRVWLEASGWPGEVIHAVAATAADSEEEV